MRVTGAQRLALAGVGETRIITFGRWSGMVFWRYVREAVLGVNGGDLSAQVEQALAERKVYEAFEASARGTDSVALHAEFKDRMLSDPMHALQEDELQVKWRAFLQETQKAEQLMAGRALPKMCVSDAGITHSVLDWRHTRCGWHWSRSVSCQTVEGAAVTCRKCAGCSVRWGR